ncbi:YceI family protein [Alteriqipengyuania sp. WL0013]|uniref:YceI family protein n=1 Tax=Alteriqipengyuania sp. WL0013 TaxID=3110773 RepID=UPI002B54BF05|nr:YceI family protein [Alteriqipengyuania sp. WL0013]MEB3416572.1 YceI family protein [Alteriqipengyuania sp. WL0013]
MKKYAIALAAAGSLAAIATLPASADHHGADLPGQMDVSRVAAGTYQTDPAHTLVGWSVNHFGFNDYHGVFGDAEGTLVIDPANPQGARVSVSVPITSVAVPSEGLRNHLLRPGKDGGSPDFFGAEPAPATFESTAVTVYGDGTRAIVAGNLSMNGVTKPVTIEARFTGAGSNPMSQAETIGFHGTTTIMRSDFGIDYALPVVGDAVELTISAAFEKQ